MSRWMINARGQQFSVANLEELKAVARKGDVRAGDIVQPPGASDWVYALEVQELAKVLRTDADDIDGPGPAAAEMSTTVKGIIAAVMALSSVALWSYALQLRASIPDQSEIDLLGDKGLKFSEVLVTESAPLRSTASVSAPETGKMEKNGSCELLAKRGKWYKLRCNGVEGYAEVDTVVPAYYFGENKDRADYDPLYNPDRYVSIANYAWRQPLDSKTSNFSFMIQNKSKFGMTDVKLVATIKDKSDREVQSVEIPIEGVIPPQDSVMIGTMKPAKGDSSPPRIITSLLYQEILKTDAKAADRWSDGVEVAVTAEDPEASIDIVEVRAVQGDK